MSLCDDKNSSAKNSESVPFSPEVLDDCFGHPHTPGVVEVEHVMDWLSGAPLAELVHLHGC